MALLTQQEFVDFILNEMKTIAPNYEFVKEDDLNYEVKAAGEKGAKLKIFLGNIWENYQRTNDINVTKEFLDVQVNLFKQIDTDIKDIDLDTVYPVLRGVGFGSRKFDEKDAGMVFDEFSKDLEVLYVEDSPTHVSFVTKSRIPDGMTEEQLTDRAFENLKKQGWVEPVEKLDIGDYATLYFFDENNKQYHGQFLVSEMYKEHLGDYFQFVLPTRTTAVVIAFKKDPDDFLPIATQLSVKLKMTGVNMYNDLPNPLSHVIHRMSEEGVKVLG